jgi:hypothetical protein
LSLTLPFSVLHKWSGKEGVYPRAAPLSRLIAWHLSAGHAEKMSRDKRSSLLFAGAKVPKKKKKGFITLATGFFIETSTYWFIHLDLPLMLWKKGFKMTKKSFKNDLKRFLNYQKNKRMWPRVKVLWKMKFLKNNNLTNELFCDRFSWLKPSWS